MGKTMLIDAQHSEEIRIAVLDENNNIEEFDYANANKIQTKGNIYLAKVTRVEAALQAAFVEYGKDRQGFLPFAEVHPDYYQIPKEDRDQLLADMQKEAGITQDPIELPGASEPLDEHAEPAISEDNGEKDAETEEDSDSADNIIETVDDAMEEDVEILTGEADVEYDDEDDENDAESKTAKQKLPAYRRYHIQEVLRKGQLILVQVNKEERGSKGASMTTYISLAGRYCVLMPNSTKAGGISRKISDGDRRKKLKDITGELSKSSGMSVIIRTAGSDRTKAEIRRDFDYLTRLWNDLREQTLSSIAPALIYEEGNIIKSAIRDLYQDDIDTIQVQGEAAYKHAKSFMKMLMPSRASRIKHFKKAEPLLHDYGVEDQLKQIEENHVVLPSGSSIVFGITEALVAVDVNSGKATGERSIEETALRTNIEAAKEVARQLRLRDLAGLIVIDFIDMFEYKNRRAVEKALKDALKKDRAKIQIGRISAFGLLEMSRQRLRTSTTELMAVTCHHCQGTGIVRSQETLSMQVIRQLEHTVASAKTPEDIQITLPTALGLYLLNNKRHLLGNLESQFAIRIHVRLDEHADTESLSIIPLVEAANEEKDKHRPNNKKASRKRKKSRKEDEQAGNKKKSTQRSKKAEKENPDGPETDEKTETDAGDETDDKRSRNRRRRGGRKRNRRRDNDQTETNDNASPDRDAVRQDEPPSASNNNVAADSGTPDSKAESEKPSGQKKRGATRKSSGTNAENSGSPTSSSKPDTPKVLEMAGGGNDNAEPRERRKGWWQKLID